MADSNSSPARTLFGGVVVILGIVTALAGIGSWLAWGSGNQNHEGILGILTIVVGFISLSVGAMSIYIANFPINEG